MCDLVAHLLSHVLSFVPCPPLPLTPGDRGFAPFLGPGFWIGQRIMKRLSHLLVVNLIRQYLHPFSLILIHLHYRHESWAPPSWLHILAGCGLFWSFDARIGEYRFNLPWRCFGLATADGFTWWLVFFRVASRVERSLLLTRRTWLQLHHGWFLCIAFLIFLFHPAPSAAGRRKPSRPIQHVYPTSSFRTFPMASTCIGVQNLLHIRACFVASCSRSFPPPVGTGAVFLRSSRWARAMALSEWRPWGSVAFL